MPDKTRKIAELRKVRRREKGEGLLTPVTFVRKSGGTFGIEPDLERVGKSCRDPFDVVDHRDGSSSDRGPGVEGFGLVFGIDDLESTCDERKRWREGGKRSQVELELGTVPLRAARF